MCRYRRIFAGGWAILVLATTAGAQSLQSKGGDSAVWRNNAALPQTIYRDFLKGTSSTSQSISPQGEDFSVQSIDPLLFGKSSPEVKSGIVGALRNEATNGNLDASIRLGAAYELGLGVPKDDDAAFAFYYEAAQNKNAVAQRIVGRAYMSGVGTAPNFAESFKWLTSAYELGDRSASVDLAKLYQFGLGVTPNNEQSQAYWKQAIQQHVPEAYLGYAQFLAEEKRTPSTDPSVRSLVETAAELGDPQAIRAAFTISIKAQDRGQEEKWRNRLVELSNRGDILSTLELGDGYASRSDNLDDQNLAMRLYRTAATTGNIHGLAKYGAMVLEHPELEPNVSKSEAKALVTRAAKGGEPTALITLASLAKDDGDSRRAYDYATAAAEIGGSAYSARAREIQLAVCAKGVDVKCEPIPVFYITNRGVTPNQLVTQYENRLGTKLSMGHSLVSIPTDGTVKVQEKSWLELISDLASTVYKSPERSIPSLADGDIVNARFDGPVAEFLKIVKEVGERNGRKKVVVFIHGFANTFDDAIRRLALVSEGAKYPGIPLVLSWASAGEPIVRLSSADGYSGLGYLNDGRTADQSCADFQQVLEQVIDVFGSENVIVLAHSMGGQLVDYFLTGCPGYAVPWSSSRKIENLILAAPDVDLAAFSKPTHVEKVLSAVNNFTLYVSANDLALRFSQDAGGQRRRLGQGGPDRFLADKIMTIDATTVEKSDDLNHAYVFDFPQVKRDLSDVFHGKTDPDDRDCPKPEKDVTANLEYWIIRPDCTN